MVRESAPAKINLFLHVVGRRADGYHLLESLVAFADIGDVVDVAPAGGLKLTVEGPFAQALAGEADNLVLRAVRRLAEFAGRPPHVAVRLIKNLPVGAGLGGGSSDAAATLRALIRLWGIAISPLDLRRIGMSLGADVAVCLEGRTTMMRGIGDDLAFLDAPWRSPAILIYPGQGLLTRDVFERRAGPYSGPLRQEMLFATITRHGLESVKNDLTAAASSLCPDIIQVIEKTKQYEGAWVARMSGSGSACFALFDTVENARAAAGGLTAERPNWWVRAAILGAV